MIAFNNEPYKKQMTDKKRLVSVKTDYSKESAEYVKSMNEMKINDETN